MDLTPRKLLYVLLPVAGLFPLSGWLFGTLPGELGIFIAILLMFAGGALVQRDWNQNAGSRRLMAETILGYVVAICGIVIGSYGLMGVE